MQHWDIAEKSFVATSTGGAPVGKSGWARRSDTKLPVKACCFSSCNAGVPWPFRLVADVGKKLCKRIVERVGSRSFTASLVTLWQSLCGVIRLKREVDAWDQQRCLALIPYPEEVSDFRGFRPVSALLQESAGLRFPSWTAVWSLEWSAASSFEAGDTCSKEPIILLLPIRDISGVCTCKFIIFGPFWFQLRFLHAGEIKHRKHLGCVDARQNKGVFCVQPDKFRALGEQSESDWIPPFFGMS